MKGKGAHGELWGAGSNGGGLRDRLFYIADMASEMKDLAEKDNCRTLAGLFALAASEALLKAGE